MNTTTGGSRADVVSMEHARTRRLHVLGYALLVVLAYVPVLLTKPGRVVADTKTYLYLDPGRLLERAASMWDPNIGMGTVTHQNIGYLWPMGPFYWLFDKLGFPDWVAQRIWIGLVILAAGLGVRYLCRTLGWAREQWGAVLVAMLAYMFSPYLLNYSARISVILLPWSALPWLIALTARAIRHGGWRHPALFALAMLTVGGVNATALILVGLGPLLYVVHAVWIDREATLRQSLAAIARMGLLTLVTSLWWLAGLWAEGRYGLPVIRYTETYRTVATVSSAPEVLRGLGYWFFYGSDKLGPWTQPSSTYTTNVAVLTLSYAIPVAAIVAAAVVRWRYRALFLTIVVVGGLTAVAAHPWCSWEERCRRSGAGSPASPSP
jgi:arabinofuranan 3-O-arabinosyltransferase